MRLYQKPSGLWAVDYVTPDGSRRRVSTGSRDKAEARKRARGIVNGTIEPQPQVPAKPSSPAAGAVGTMDALWTRCENTIWHPREIRSLRTLASNLKILRSIEITTEDYTGLFASLAPAAIRYSHLDALQQALFAKGYAPGTVARKMNMVGKSLTQAAKWEVIPAKPPMPSLPSGAIRERVIREDEEAAIFRAVKRRAEAEPGRNWKRYGMLLRFLMDTACRLGEALACTADWFEETERGWVLNIPATVTKSGKGRTIPVSAAIAADLPYLRENAGRGGRLFPMTAGTAQYAWRHNIDPDVREVDGFDLSDVVLHSFRHTKLTRLAKMPGFGIHRVSKWAGHADIKITAKVYAKLDVDDLWAGA